MHKEKNAFLYAVNEKDKRRNNFKRKVNKFK